MSPERGGRGATPGARLRARRRPARRLGVVGLFAGIGGIEKGLSEAGHHVQQSWEIDPAATAVLRQWFSEVPLAGDVRELRSLPSETHLITAGFPCQDLSQAGRTEGFDGPASGLWKQVFRILKLERKRVPLVLFENVPFMLRLGRGRGFERLITRLERMNYRWAYRVVDSMAFGVPQRRERVYLVAAQDEDPKAILFADESGIPEKEFPTRDRAFGFYWTEGTRGLGAAVDAVPTLKAGSTIGIPSPPAIALPRVGIVTPSIEDAERLQGFPAGWTKPAEQVARPSHRWRLVGNAVTVDVARWLGRRFAVPGEYDSSSDEQLPRGAPWPDAAWGEGGKRFVSTVSPWPVRVARPPLAEFLRGRAPLSLRATEGFHRRLERSSLNRPRWFDEAVKRHLQRMRGREARGCESKAARS